MTCQRYLYGKQPQTTKHNGEQHEYTKQTDNLHLLEAGEFNIARIATIYCRFTCLVISTKRNICQIPMTSEKIDDKTSLPVSLGNPNSVKRTLTIITIIETKLQ
ncbi:hypothetical protein [Cardiobacterium hominis]|uniref:hypothetical protein n=1 Tax=Cardiobacterium hominis TaxID=2718 RepID=UPI0028D46C52|nr:hypothetical protein [Cardiobacterium hominis]